MRTMGVEEELLLADPLTGVPVPAAGQILSRAATRPGVAEQGNLFAEMQQEVVEVVTHPHASLADLGGEVLRNRTCAQDLAEAFDAVVAPLATSPMPVTPHATRSDRYEQIVQRFGSLPRRNLTCGLHVHVAVDSAHEGVGVLDRIRAWTPVLIALSANSPFHDGVDTGHASYRSLLWNQWPSAGPMDRYGSAQRYAEVTGAMLTTGALLDDGMLYPDARLSRTYPTVEVRVADVPMDPGVTVTLAGIVRALVDTAANELRAGVPAADVPTSVIKLANWCAALDGLDGRLVHPVTGASEPAGEVVMALLEHVMPALRASGDAYLVERGIAEIFAAGTGAQRQRAVHAATDSLAHIPRVASATSAGARSVGIRL